MTTVALLEDKTDVLDLDIRIPETDLAAADFTAVATWTSPDLTTPHRSRCIRCC